MWNIVFILGLLSLVFATAIVCAWKRQEGGLSMAIVVWLMLIAGLFYTVLVGESHRDARRQAELREQPDRETESSLGSTLKPTGTAESAQETIEQMLALAKDYAWWKLIDGYYGERSKLKNDRQKSLLQNEFEHGYGRKLIPVLEQAVEIVPVIEDGKAFFISEGETIYILFLDEDGGWGFHL